jgi:hypothetical protein
MFFKNSALSDIIKIVYVGRWWCPELIPDIEKFLPVAIFKMATTIPQKFNIVRYHKNLICGQIMISRIDSRHWKISTSRHFQNGHHNNTQIQHCPISTPFHMWVDYDVPKWFLTLINFYRSPFSKWPPQYRTNSTLFDFNVLNWFPTLKNFYLSPFSKWPT